MWNGRRSFFTALREAFVPSYAREWVFENANATAIEVFVEPSADRYVLNPGDKMRIRATLGGTHLSLTSHNGGFSIFAGNDDDPIVWINGDRAESDWDTQLSSD